MTHSWHSPPYSVATGCEANVDGQEGFVTLREKLEKARPTIDSLTYRRITGQISETDYYRGREEEQRRLGVTQAPKQAADGR